MLVLDQENVNIATAAMCVAAELPIEALQDKTYRDQVVAFILALNKNHEREQTYKGLWRDDSLDEIGALIAHKGKRLQRHDAHISPGGTMSYPNVFDDATDDALDVINYGAFCARQVHYAARDAGMESTQS